MVSLWPSGIIKAKLQTWSIKKAVKQVLKGLLIGRDRVLLSAGAVRCDKVDTSAHLASDSWQSLQRSCNNGLDYLLLPETIGCFISETEVKDGDPSLQSRALCFDFFWGKIIKFWKKIWDLHTVFINLFTWILIYFVLILFHEVFQYSPESACFLLQIRNTVFQFLFNAA